MLLDTMIPSRQASEVASRMRRRLLSSDFALVLWLTLAANCMAQTPTMAELDAARAEISAMRREQRALLEKVRAEFAALPALPSKRENESGELSRQRKKREEMQRLLKQVEARIDAEGGATRTHYASPSSLRADPVVQAYHDRLIKKIEERGTMSFPMQDGKSVYGKVTLILSLDALGRVFDIEVADSTSPFLASHSQKLVRDLAPFEPFPSEMARSTDLLVTRLPFNFKDD